MLAPPDVTVALADFATHRSTPLGRRGKDRESVQLFRGRGHAVRGRLGPAAHLPLDARRPLGAERLPAADAVRGVLPAGARRRGPVLPRARAAGRAGRLAATATRPPWCAPIRRRAGRHPRPAGAARHRRGDGRRGRRFERRVFSGADQWGALPDGSLWVARVYAQSGRLADSRGRVDPRRAAARPGARGDPLRSRAVPPPVSARASQHGRAAAVRAGEAAVRGRASPARRARSGWRRAARRSTRAAAITWSTARAGCARRSGCPGPGVSSPSATGRRAGRGAVARRRPAAAIRASGPPADRRALTVDRRRVRPGGVTA